MCVSLLDSATGSTLSATSTDGNGYFAFEMAEITEPVQIHFQKTENLDFVTPNLGDDDTDSDADPASGLTESFDPQPGSRFWSAGFTPKAIPAAEEGRVQP
ncbi:SdrD B-like domain-containing protein, partial [Arthrospira platensis SPKY1]|nr:SdrD B-like domain-containing protein [Arthrospira platensis SPKY1]